MEVELGCCGGCWVFGGDFWVGNGCRGKGCNAGCWVDLGDELGEIWKALGVLICCVKEEEEMLIFCRERGRILG